MHVITPRYATAPLALTLTTHLVLKAFKALSVSVVWHKHKLGIFATIVFVFCFSGASEGTISMQEGEVLAVVEEDKGDGWTRVRRNNGDEGYIPTSYVTIILNKWETHKEQ